MKLLSFQPGSLYQNGGAGRVLRRLYLGKESSVVSVFLRSNNLRPRKGIIAEYSLDIYPLHRKWMRWKLRDFVFHVRDKLLYKYNFRRIPKAVDYTSFDVLHTISDGPYSTALCDRALTQKKRLWVSFHDHYLLCSTFEDTHLLWSQAERRLVISEELGKKYQEVFGHKEFEVITDGVARDEISTPLDLNAIINKPYIIYFSGLLHLAYYPLFQVLADALDVLADKSVHFKLILRGSQELSFLTNRKFEVEYRTNFVSDNEIKIELDEATILYLPIKFTEPNFYLYSMSTKMVSYLGGRGAILYHGPGDSAVGKLLLKYDAAVCCTSFDLKEMVDQLLTFIDNSQQVSAAAKRLAVEQFDLNTIQKRFWQEAD